MAGCAFPGAFEHLWKARYLPTGLLELTGDSLLLSLGLR